MPELKCFYHETLIYYDGIQVFKALDDARKKVYLGVCVETGSLADKFLVVEVKPDSDLSIENLRTLILERPNPEWYLLQTDDFEGALLLKQQSGDIPEEYLPEKEINMPLISKAAKLLDVPEKELQEFDMPDTFNPGNTIAGYLCRRGDHRYGALVINMVNGVGVEPQVVWCTPKLHYPFGRTEMEDRNYHFPKKIIRVGVYEKLDGTNVLAYSYADAEGTRYRTFKTRLTPILSDNRFGALAQMWNELLEDKHLQMITSVQALKNQTLSFEMYGYRNPHLVVYKDIPLSAKLLFSVDQIDQSIRPSNGVFFEDWGGDPPYQMYEDQVMMWPMAVLTAPQWVLVPEATLESPEDLVAFYESKRDEAEAQNKSFGEDTDKTIEGIEGFIFYTLVEGGEWEMWKCKPPSVEDIHWTQGNSVPMTVIVPTAWNALESCDGELTPEYIRSLLLEEFSPEQVGKSEIRIGKAVAYINGRVNRQIKVRALYDDSGLDWEKDGRGNIMRMLSKHFDSKEMKKVYQSLTEMGIVK